jgi:nitrate reductase beta subunit
MYIKYIEGVPQKKIAYNAKGAKADKALLDLNWCDVECGGYKKKRAS